MDATSHPHTAVAGALVAGTTLLLCYRHPGRRWFPDVWDFPGGHPRTGEGAAAALRRELYEEIGVVVAASSLNEPEFEIRDLNLWLRIWTVRSWSGQARNLAPREHDRIAWFNRADAHRLSLAHPSYRGLINRILSPRMPAAKQRM